MELLWAIFLILGAFLLWGFIKGYSGSSSHPLPGDSFRTTIAGVTKQNSDGTDRHALILALKPGEELFLVREPENPYDRFAIAVFNSSRQQLGYIPAGDFRLADHIDKGGSVSVKVGQVTGGGIIGMFFKRFRKPHGCVLEITKGDFNWSEVRPYEEKGVEIRELIMTARALEKEDATKAIKTYRQAIDEILALEKSGSVASAWRQSSYPINRLSLLLDKSGDYRSAYEEILRYEKSNDSCGLTEADEKSVLARKQRLLKKLNRLNSLKGGGNDDPNNMQSQTKKAAKAKDKVE